MLNSSRMYQNVSKGMVKYIVFHYWCWKYFDWECWKRCPFPNKTLTRFRYEFYDSKVGFWETKSGVSFGKTCLSVGEPINNVGHNCGKENVGQDVRLADDTVISNPQFSHWQIFPIYYRKGGSIWSDQSASRNRGDDFSSWRLMGRRFYSGTSTFTLVLDFLIGLLSWSVFPILVASCHTHYLKSRLSFFSAMWR
jgi:hypothetical protein